MAFTRLNSLPFSLLILSSLLAIAFAADYGYDGIPGDSPLVKPISEEKPVYYQNKPEVEEKQNYGSKPEIYKPKPEEIERPEYEKKPYVVKPKPLGEDQKTHYDTAKPEFYKPKPAEREEKPYTIAVEGFVYCKTGPSHYPIPGAFAKVICQAIDEINGVEKTVLCNAATDAKGYFYATVNEPNLKLKDCKAFLETSPEKACNVPTDVNKGVTGFPLSGDYQVLHEKHTNLYSARPFFFTSESDEPKPATPNGY